VHERRLLTRVRGIGRTHVIEGGPAAAGPPAPSPLAREASWLGAVVTRIGQLVGIVAAAAATCAVSADASPTSASLTGGTYRVGWEQMRFDFEPTNAPSDTLGLYTNLLVRTLVQYDHVAGAAGTKVVPDLAVRVPRPTSGGLVYTFKLKRGIRYGPPVDREISSRDIRYAIERMARPRNGAGYPLAFAPLRGFAAYRSGHARTISGISTPNARTIAFRLARPTGDFLHRLTLPAAAPIPAEVARCFEGRPGEYGRDLVSSGPYMLDGADAVRAGSCRELTPMRGASESQLRLVRNPRYDPRTDRRAARESNPDRFVFVAVIGRVQAGSAYEIVDKLRTGELEDGILTSTKVIEKAAPAARARGRLRVNTAQWLDYISLNLTQPPFDDVHVRRALAWVLDRAAIRAAWGGPLAGTPARHVVPEVLLGGRLSRFAPFATRGDHGDLAKAKAEMAQSTYATKNGVCTAGACKGVFLHAFQDCTCYAAGQRIVPIVNENARRIGIAVHAAGGEFDRFLVPSRNIPAAVNADWVGDYPDPANVGDRLFRGASIQPEGNWNTSLLGIASGRAAALGIKGRVGSVPSVDRDLARCDAFTGSGRIGCYAALDRKLTTEIVPIIPILWRSRVSILGRQVAKWRFDQSTGMPSFAHAAVRR
jgi:peptide/nickel transport system substrate-binding protein